MTVHAGDAPSDPTPLDVPTAQIPAAPVVAGVQVVLGAAGSAGSAILEALTSAGLPTRGVGRGPRPASAPAQAEWIGADLRDERALAAALAGAGAVHMAGQPPYHRWPEEFPAMLEAVLGATSAVGARLVMVDNCYAYGPGSSPMTEAAPSRATDRKGRVRAAMADALLAAHAEGRCEVVLGRASDYFGPGAANSGITALAVEPVAGTGKLRWMGSLDAAHSCAYLPDIARAYVLLGTEAGVTGRAWHLPHAPAVTGREFLSLVNRCLPAPRSTAVVSTAMLRLASPVHRISRESLAIAYQWTEPFVVDDADFRRRFPAFEVTPLEDAVRETVAAARAESGSAA
jgi:nucleoside-diphosphate-sugar epimerase